MTSKPAEIREVIKEASELETELMPPSVALPPVEIPEIPIKRVVLFLIFFYITIVAIRLLFLEGPSFLASLKNIGKPGFQILSSPTVLYGYFIYMCVACQFFPIPTLPPIAFTAKIFHPVLVAFVGAIGTCVANLNDYAILGWLFRHNPRRCDPPVGYFKSIFLPQICSSRLCRTFSSLSHYCLRRKRASNQVHSGDFSHQHFASWCKVDF
jgi:hypothetical protein